MKITGWYHKNFFSYLLWPFSFIYRCIVRLRRKCYEWHILKTTHFSIPIIIIGNITVGGTGKTPLVIFLVNFLRAQGLRPGVVSRGYKGKSRNYPLLVTPESKPSETGDEPLLIYQQTKVSVIVDPNRVRGVRKLLAVSNCNVILSDDGLQHYALGRDIEIIVIDGKRKLGNGFCLPAGPLREPAARLKTIDFTVINGSNSVNSYRMDLIPENFFYAVKEYGKPNPSTKMCSDFIGKEVNAVAGIGNHWQFFDLLRQLGLHINEHPFADHHFFKPADFSVYSQRPIIMTEKDAVKCAAFADDRFWFLPIKAQLEPSFTLSLLKKLNVLAH